jgi:16S rRNA (adenine(1408)-N(1))-methyltransferase
MLALGIDANAAGMAEAASRAARKPSRGGAPNARFVVSATEAFPTELAAVADLVTVQFPWGSLLRGLVCGEAEFVDPIARLLKPSQAELGLLLSIDGRDTGLGLEPLDERSVEHVVEAFEDRGLRAFDVRPATRQDLVTAHSTWAKRLRVGSGDRSAWIVRLGSDPWRCHPRHG